MATIEKRRYGYRLVFWYQGEGFQGPVKTEKRHEAESLKARVERNLQLLQEGRIDYIEGDNLFLLMLSDGKLNARPQIAKRINLKDFFERYQQNRPPSKEASTTYTEDIHIAHLIRHLGSKTSIAELNASKLQQYISLRLAEKNRQGELISFITVKKEIGSLSSIWNKWGVREGLVSSVLPTRNLDFGKRKETIPFQTWEQIARKTNDPKSDLWDSLFLSSEQIEEFLRQVRNSKLPWVYPMMAFCAYTGARRSEMLRARVIDVDFANHEITIREKKKDTSVRETYRHVAMVPQLENALKAWLKSHPGGEWLFSKTVHEPITVQMSNHYFRNSVDGSKWEVMRGWHTLRHSLVSNLVAKGISETIIMGIVGHLNPSTTRRYSHLFPKSLEAALGVVFGKRKRAIAEVV